MAAAKEVFSFIGYSIEVNLKFISEEEIKRINYKLRGQDRATNVLAFGFGDKVGDIVISNKFVAKEARRLNYEVRDLILLYLVHGILHLAGFDHMIDKERVKMEMAEEQIMSNLGIKISR